MKLARTSGDDVPTAAVNLALINTTPQQLAEMAKAKFDLDEDSGTSATECNGQGMGPTAIAPEQPPAATHGCPIPEKETPPSAPEQPVRVDPPSSPAVQEREARLAAIAKARAEHRRANWEKYRYAK